MSPPAPSQGNRSSAAGMTQWLRERWSWDWRAALGPLLLVLLATAFNLWVLRAQTLPAQNLNDSSLHEQMVRWAVGQIHEGRVPLDGWYPYLQLGAAFFHHYQSLPHIVTAYLGVAVGASTAFDWTLYLLLAMWPLSVYWGTRLLGWGRWPAGVAALVSPLLVSTPGLGFEHGSYVWRGYGVWSQLWGMWMLPLALGLSWRAVSGKRGYALGALAIALTIASHFIVGYFALLLLGVFVVVRPSEFAKRLARGIVVGVAGVLAGSWAIIPLIVDSRWVVRTISLEHTFYTDSYGARKVLGWLFTGQLFDAGRLPVVTLLVGAGIVTCLRRFRVDERARVLLGIFGVSLALYFGRPTLGPLLNLLPGSGDLLFHRFIIGIHLGGILLAGVGGAWVGGALHSLIRRSFRAWSPAAVIAGVIVLGVLALLPAWRERAAYDGLNSANIKAQIVADATDGRDVDALIFDTKALGGGRIYAGTRANWGSNYRVGDVPVYSIVANRNADGVGFTLRVSSLSADVETYFDETNPADYDLFAIRYLILPEDRQPPVPATLLDHRGRHTLWTVQTTGYFQVIDTSGSITADRSNLVQQVAPFLVSPLLVRGIYPVVAFAGSPGGVETLASGSNQKGPPGRVDSVYNIPADGLFGAHIVANRPAVVLLKSSYDPRWKVVVDGDEQPTQMIAPSFVGVAVPAGGHTILFRYAPIPFYPYLFAIGGLCLLGLALGARIHWGPKAPGAKPRPTAASEPEKPVSSLASDPEVAGVFVVIPAYNEEASLGPVLRDLLDSGGNVQVVVVDDASSDRTAETARSYPIHLLRHVVNLGQGAALKTGIDFALRNGAEIIVTFDADGQMAARDIPRIVEPVAAGRCDVALGTRFAGVRAPGMTRGRELFLRAAVVFTRAATRLPLTDAHNGFRALSRSAAERIQITQNRMAHASQILSELARLDLRWEEVPIAIRYSAYSRQKGQSPLGAVDIMIDLLRSSRR